MTGITEPTARMLVRKYLSALQGYPLHEDGQKCLAMYLTRYALNVEHGEAIVQAFKSKCPTPQDLHDAAFQGALRAKFSPKPKDLKQQWVAQGYTLDSGFYDRLMAENANRKPGEPRDDDRLWRAIKQKLAVRDFARVPMGACLAAKRDLGFPLTTGEQEELERWEAGGGRLSPTGKFQEINPALEERIKNLDKGYSIPDEAEE